MTVYDGPMYDTLAIERIKYGIDMQLVDVAHLIKPNPLSDYSIHINAELHEVEEHLKAAKEIMRGVYGV